MSLYQVIQGFDCVDQTLSVSPNTVENLVSSFIDLLIEQQIETTVWVKPATSWIQEIERYQNQGKIVKTYWCQTFSGGNSTLAKLAQSKIVSLKLESREDLEREFFLIVISEQFSGLILTQQQPVSTMPTKLKSRHLSLKLKLFCSFDPCVIEKVLEGVIKAIADSTPNNLPQKISLPSSSSNESNLILKLLLKQIEQTESITTGVPVSSTNKPQGNFHHESLLLQEEFISQLNRELRPPLTNMRTAICLLESKYLKISQRQRYIELLHREWNRQNCLLTGLLELVQLDHLSYQEKSIASDITEILPGIISTYQPIAKEQNIQLGYKLPATLPLIFCPNLWLKQIILNLLNNNLKFTPSGGKVFVEASLTQAGVEISFIDTGNGISSNELSKIFDSFYRGRNSQGEENSGAGLGLTIVKQLLDRCDGSITVSSQINKGSVFKVLFQLAHSQGLDT